MIKYLGSKRVLLPWIARTVDTIGEAVQVHTVGDLFSGTSRVAHMLKGKGYRVTANDNASYAHVIAQALVEADRDEYPPERIEPILRKLSSVEPVRGFITRTYAEEARFFQPKNGARIDGIRAKIDDVSEDDPLLRAILLTSLMLAADRVDSTTGVQMAYLKQWAKRSYKDLALRYPPILPGGGEALRMDAVEAAGAVDVDLVYLDPPYNQHAYLSNYHIWETLVRNDAPEVYGKAKKRVDCRTRKSPFNRKREARVAMQAVIEAVTADHLLISFSDEGYIGREEMLEALGAWPHVTCLARGHKRYIGAQIGVHNPDGEKVGEVSHTENTEYLFVATRNATAHAAIREAASHREATQLSMF